MDALPFTVISKKIKYLILNLTKEMKELVNGNFEPLKKKIEKYSGKYMSDVCVGNL